MKVIDYRIVQGLCIEEAAQNLIREGYQPLGAPGYNGNCLCQAMVKYRDEEAAV
ncbi:MAG: hypothetical protein AABZ39_07560 [Spirochaetota bacterium]